MDMQKSAKILERRKDQSVPQVQVRSGIAAGASVESCLEDLYYWQNQYYKKCGGPKPVLYTQ